MSAATQPRVNSDGSGRRPAGRLLPGRREEQRIAAGSPNSARCEPRRASTPIGSDACRTSARNRARTRVSSDRSARALAWTRAFPCVELMEADRDAFAAQEPRRRLRPAAQSAPATQTWAPPSAASSVPEPDRRIPAEDRPPAPDRASDGGDAIVRRCGRDEFGGRAPLVEDHSRRSAVRRPSSSATIDAKSKEPPLMRVTEQGSRSAGSRARCLGPRRSCGRQDRHESTSRHLGSIEIRVGRREAISIATRRRSPPPTPPGGRARRPRRTATRSRVAINQVSDAAESRAPAEPARPRARTPPPKSTRDPLRDVEPRPRLGAATPRGSDAAELHQPLYSPAMLPRRGEHRRGGAPRVRSSGPGRAVLAAAETPGASRDAAAPSRVECRSRAGRASARCTMSQVDGFGRAQHARELVDDHVEVDHRVAVEDADDPVVARQPSGTRRRRRSRGAGSARRATRSVAEQQVDRRRARGTSRTR